MKLVNKINIKKLLPKKRKDEDHEEDIDYELLNSDNNNKCGADDYELELETNCNISKFNEQDCEDDLTSPSIKKDKSQKNRKFNTIICNLKNLLDGLNSIGKSKDFKTVIAEEIDEIYDELESQILNNHRKIFGEFIYEENIFSKDEFYKSGHIVYPVKPPFQYACVKDIEGATTYIALEPELNVEELNILKTIDETFDKLIVIETPVFDEFDKKQFLWEKFLDILELYGWKLSKITKHRLFYHFIKKHLGYERIDILMNDPNIEDISCNGLNSKIFIYHRVFESIPTNIEYTDEYELNNFILKMAQMGGKHVSILQPIRDLALPDGSRVNLTIGKEVSKKGSTFTIRKFRSKPISPVELMKSGSVNADLLSYMWFILEYKKSMLVSGGTAAGKTTFLNAVCMFINPEFKIVSLEDTPEINLQHPNWAQMITRSGFGVDSGSDVSGVSGISGFSKTPGEIGLFDLLVAALRQRPEYIIVGEVRGQEAFTLFQAIAVGHACLGTIHAGTMQELISRLESPPMNVPRILFSNIDVVVFPALIKKEGRAIRRVKYVVEILGMEPETKNLITNTVYKWNPVEDKLKFQGRSYIIEKIQDELGFSNEYVQKELSKRKDLLNYMYSNGIHDYKEVTKLIHDYIKNRNKLEDEGHGELS